MVSKNLAKKALLAASLTVGVVGVNSFFNEAQATGVAKTHSCVTVQSSPYHKSTTCVGSGSACSSVSSC
jgi:hypothetical protein